MKYEEIQSLLDRYWEGETSLEEERALKAYFGGTTVDDRLKAVAPLFKAIKEEQQVEIKTKARTVQLRPTMYYWAAAASVAMLMLAGWWMMQQKTPEDPVAALPSIQPPALTEPAPIVKQEETFAALNPKPPIINKKPVKRTARKPQTQEIDPETAKAMAEIKAALALVSAKLDKGKKQAVQKASYLEVVEKLPRKTDG